jgi:ABC-type protease/lipase transport system fused ATPase/permease subunit
VAHLPFSYLSAGQQRRIALARLLVSHRPLWLLDEPTAALDSRSDRLFADLVRQHLEAGGMAIAATHQPLGLENVRSLELSGIHSAASGELGMMALILRDILAIGTRSGGGMLIGMLFFLAVMAVDSLSASAPI